MPQTTFLDCLFCNLLSESEDSFGETEVNTGVCQATPNLVIDCAGKATASDLSRN